MSKDEHLDVYDLLYKYRGTFSLRDEIRCPNIEVDLQVIDKSQLYVKEEDKPMIEKEMQRLVHVGILKQDMSLYSSHIILFARRN